MISGFDLSVDQGTYFLAKNVVNQQPDITGLRQLIFDRGCRVKRIGFVLRNSESDRNSLLLIDTNHHGADHFHTGYRKSRIVGINDNISSVSGGGIPVTLNR